MLTVLANCTVAFRVMAFRHRIADWVETNPWGVLISLFFVMVPDTAFAANGMEQFLCSVATNFKTIVGVCALVAIVFWAIEHVFGVSKIHDMVIKIGIACAVIAGAATLINASGLTTCSSF